MGLESTCTLRLGRQSWNGRALLESESIIFRGDGRRLEIPFRAIAGVEATDGQLRVSHAEGEARFDIGAAAEKWAEKIRNPRTLLDKLGVKPDSRVAVVKVDDAKFLAQLATRASDVTVGTPKKESDLVFFAAESKAAAGPTQDVTRVAQA